MHGGNLGGNCAVYKGSTSVNDEEFPMGSD